MSIRSADIRNVALVNPFFSSIPALKADLQIQVTPDNVQIIYDCLTEALAGSNSSLRRKWTPAFLVSLLCTAVFLGTRVMNQAAAQKLEQEKGKKEVDWLTTIKETTKDSYARIAVCTMFIIGAICLFPVVYNWGLRYQINVLEKNFETLNRILH